MAVIVDEITTTVTSLAWSLLDSATTAQTLVMNRGYIADSSSLVTFTLPTTATPGDVVAVVNRGSGGWIIAQNASQSIRVIGVTTTTGTGGSLASTNRGDVVYLVCETADVGFKALWVMGNLTYV